jgi:hypothetical protein
MNIYQLQNKLYSDYGLSTILSDDHLYKHSYIDKNNITEYYILNEYSLFGLMSNRTKRAIGEEVSDFMRDLNNKQYMIMF